MQETLGDLLHAKRLMTDVCPHKPSAKALAGEKYRPRLSCLPVLLTESEDSQKFCSSPKIHEFISK